MKLEMDKGTKLQLHKGYADVFQDTKHIRLAAVMFEDNKPSVYSSTINGTLYTLEYFVDSWRLRIDTPSNAGVMNGVHINRDSVKVSWSKCNNQRNTN